jgi:hypothetical protein
MHKLKSSARANRPLRAKLRVQLAASGEPDLLENTGNQGSQAGKAG